VIVIDASAAVELVLNTAGGGQVRDRIADANVALHAPHLLGVEVAQVLRRYVAAGQLDDGVALDALHDFADLDIERHPVEPFLPRVWELRSNLTAYDAAYVALAEVLEAPLLTFDGRLASSPGHRATIDLVN